MTCEEMRQRWHVCLDEGHDDPEVNEHLASCDECQRYVRLMSRIVGTLDELHDATESIVARPTYEPWSIRRRRPRIHWPVVAKRVAAIAALVAVAIGASLYFGIEPGSTRLPLETDLVSVPDRRIGISLRGESADRFVAVAASTSQDNVQMFWLYPTLASASEPDAASSQDQEGGVAAPPADSRMPG